MEHVVRVFQLQCRWQSYPWGKQGSTSEVAQLLKSSDPSFEIDEEAMYAELWMGIHNKQPSSVYGTQETLEHWLSQHPDALGDNITSNFGSQLPFLLKILSINKVLQVQAHPGKELAEQLHAKDPATYLDPNHKPEMALALTPFRGMCGFRPVAEIANFLRDINELVAVVGRENADELIAASQDTDKRRQEQAIKCCFAALMRQEQSVIETQLRSLVQRIKKLEQENQDTSHLEGKTLLQVYKEFPDDEGCFCVYFSNIISLQPGEAIKVEAGVIHAYIEGDCVECLASSDNVVFGGLTNLPKDIDTLVEMLDYNGRPAGKFRLHAVSSEEGGCLVDKFYPPVKDFALMQIKVPASGSNCTLSAIDSASIVICVKGHGKVSNRTAKGDISMGKGIVIFIAAKEECHVTPDSDMVLFRAYVS